METVKQYFERMADGNADIDSVNIGDTGWTIELHANGLALCSPRTDARELGYPDNSEDDWQAAINATA